MIDHIVWYAEELGQGIEDFQQLAGIRAVNGGTHAGLGTHNALLALGERCYLEIIAPDPKQTNGAWRECLHRASHPGLFHWALAVPGLESLSQCAGDDLLRNRSVVRASRESANLGILSWKLLKVDGHSFGALLPLLIDWEDSPHPAQAAPRGCRLKSLKVYSPDKRRLDAFFSALNSKISVIEDTDPHFSVTMSTARGDLELNSIRPLPAGLAF